MGVRERVLGPNRHTCAQVNELEAELKATKVDYDFLNEEAQMMSVALKAEREKVGRLEADRNMLRLALESLLGWWDELNAMPGRLTGPNYDERGVVIIAEARRALEWPQ